MCALSLGLAAAAAAILTSCKPNLDDTQSIVKSPSVIAVRSDPAEVAPGGTLRSEALYVGPSGRISSTAVQWDFCEERKPLAELEPVSPLCLQAGGDVFLPLGVGNPVSGLLPASLSLATSNGNSQVVIGGVLPASCGGADASQCTIQVTDPCSLFGPQVPQPQPNQPPGRPVDPDPTGGYYQPVRILAASGGGDIITLGETRLSCGLANAPPDVSASFAQRYHVNANPAVAAFGPKGQSWVTDDKGTNAGVAPGQHLELEVSWPQCPTTDSCGDNVCGPDETPMSCATCDPSIVVCASDCVPLHGCAGAERYAAPDTSGGTLVDLREGIEVAWYATGGSFDVDRTGRGGSDTGTTSDNGWSAPATLGPVTFWIVLRDDRGGVGWDEYVVNVK